MKPQVYTTSYNRWYSEFRSYLFETIHFHEVVYNLTLFERLIVKKCLILKKSLILVLLISFICLFTKNIVLLHRIYSEEKIIKLK